MFYVFNFFFFVVYVTCTIMFPSLGQLPNRLGKMIGPLHWHDYKKKYGKLDEFVSSHPEVRIYSL